MGEHDFVMAIMEWLMAAYMAWSGCIITKEVERDRVTS